MSKRPLGVEDGNRVLDDEPKGVKEAAFELLAQQGEILTQRLISACQNDNLEQLRGIYSILNSTGELGHHVNPWFKGLDIVLAPDRASSNCRKFFETNSALQYVMLHYACQQPSTDTLAIFWKLGRENTMDSLLRALQLSMVENLEPALSFFRSHRLGVVKTQFRKMGYRRYLEPLLEKFWLQGAPLGHIQDYFVFSIEDDPFLFSYLIDFAILNFAYSGDEDTFLWRLHVVKTLAAWNEIPAEWVEYPMIIGSLLDTMVSSGWVFDARAKIAILSSVRTNIPNINWDPTISPEECYQLIAAYLTRTELEVLIDELKLVDPSDKELWELILRKGLNQNVFDLLYTRMKTIAAVDHSKYVDLSVLGGLRSVRNTAQ